MVPLASLAGAPRAGLRDGNPDRARRERLRDCCNDELEKPAHERARFTIGY
ncbi:hypothetical protein GRB31_17790 (plasmid) [Ralstonia solanacearum]|nr:hypothetical protein GRB31_17790 [Ralstonia solanacearum]